MSEDFDIKEIYQGGYSTLEPNYGEGFTGYRSSVANLGITTDPRTADILTEISQKLAPGQKTIEVSMVSPEIFESVPEPYLKEANRLSKLTGVDLTVHGPVVEPSGITKEGFSEGNREAIERQMCVAVERSHTLSPDGNVPVTFHSSGMLPGPEITKTKEGGKEIEKMLVINNETGQITAIKKEEKYYPHAENLEKPEIYSVKKQLDALNNTEWVNSLTALITPKEQADRMIAETQPLVREIVSKIETREINPNYLTPTQQEIWERFQNAGETLHDIQAHLNASFNKAYTYGTEEEKERLKKFSKKFFGEINELSPLDFKEQSKALQHLMSGLRSVNPETYQSIDNFTLDKSSTTFANVALNSYKKFKDNAPIISIENPPAGFALSTGEELKELVEKSRKKFVEEAVKQKIMSESQAKKQAEKLIGVTWDVGHINMLRKSGFEEKDIVKETEKVAPFVKHVHLSDNFGFEHTELPMGMGNVPLKEIMEKLGKKGFEGKKIVEAAQWWQHFKSSPMQESMRAMGSPIYSANMQPYWNQAIGLHQGYFSGYGSMLPDVNYSTWGAGFSTLPMELGGQMPGAQGSRFSGKGME